MISIAYALLLISFFFGTVPEAWAAPVGTRSVHVKTMRRIPFEKEHMRRVHYSAISVVQRDDVRVAAVVHEPVTRSAAALVVRETAPSVKPILVDTRNAPPSSESVPVVTRHEGHRDKNSKTDSAALEMKKSTRRHHVKNEARGGASAAPRALPRFQWDKAERRSGSKDEGKRENDASGANVAREPLDVQRKPLGAGKTTHEKRDTGTQKTQEHASHATPVRPIMMFRRAMAIENQD